MLTTFYLSVVSKSYPQIVEKTVLLKIISKALKDKTTDACSQSLGEAGSRQQSFIFLSFYCQGKKGSRSCQSILFLVFLVLRYQNEAKRKCFVVGPKCCM